MPRWLRSSGSSRRFVPKLGLSSVRDGIGSVGRAITRGGTQRFTLLVIPHSEKRLVKFQANIFAIAFFVVLFAFIFAGFTYVALHAPDATGRMSDGSRDLQSSQASLESILDELQEVMRVARLFDGAMRETVDGLRPGFGVTGPAERSTGGDLSAFLNSRRFDASELAEVEELRLLASTIRSAVEPLEEIQRLFRVQQALLQDIPNLWPVAGGRGRVSQEFGPNIHPFTGQIYLHKGFDIADAIGVPLVAMANGVVTDISVDPGYGLQMWIRHKHGFRTMYAHLHSISVREGQEVRQGQQIALMGNSGASTGPHLHLEVWLGNEVVDPAVFLTMTNDFQRRVRSLSQ